MRLLPLWIVLLVAGCGEDLGFAVRLTLDATAIDDAARARATMLRVGDEGRHSVDRSLAGRGLREEERVVVEPAAGTTSLVLAAQVFDESGALLGEGRTAELLLAPDQTTDARLVLLAPDVVFDAGVGDESKPADLASTDLAWAPATFSNPSATNCGLVPSSWAFGDLTGDGRTDVVVGSQTSGAVAMLAADSAGMGFDIPTGLVPMVPPYALLIDRVLTSGGLSLVVFGPLNPSSPNWRLVAYAVSGSVLNLQAQVALYSSKTGPWRLTAGSFDNTPNSPHTSVALFTVGEMYVGTFAPGTMSWGTYQQIAGGAYSVAMGQLGPSDAPGELIVGIPGGLNVFSDYAYAAGPPMLTYAIGPVVPPIRAAVVDLDGQAGNDVVAMTGDQTFTLLNDGTGVLTSAVGVTQPGAQLVDLAVGDLNRDGSPDLILADAANKQILILYQRGTLLGTSSIPLSAAPRAVALADLDLVGGPDVIAVLADGQVVRFLNTTP